MFLLHLLVRPMDLS